MNPKTGEIVAMATMPNFDLNNVPRNNVSALMETVKNINIVDDPFTDHAIVKQPFDDEAVPCVTKNIVENGVFKGFMHDLASANFFNVNPTGNGFKAGVSGTVSVSPTNLYLEPGDKSFDELNESEKYSLELKLLKAENKKLKMENDFLKKLEEIERRSINQV